MQLTVESKPDYWRVSKYLIPKSLASNLRVERSDIRSIITLRELAAEARDVHLRTVAGLEKAAGRSSWSVVQLDGTVEQRSLEPRQDFDANVAEIPGGRVVGRECLIVGPKGSQVAEFGFLLDRKQVRSGYSLARFNPVYYRHLRQGNLTARVCLPKARHIDGCVAVLNKRGAHCFYHWIMEVVPKICAIRQAGYQPDYYVLDCQSKYQRDMLAMLGVSMDQVIQPLCNTHLACEQLICVPRCNQAVLQGFVNSVQQSSQTLAKGPLPTKKIFISRRHARNRKLVNEREVEDYLTSLGFATLCFEELSIADQIEAMAQAETIVTSHGSALANTMFARPGAHVVEIFPHNRRNITLYPEQSRDFGLRHTTLLAKATQGRKNLRVHVQHLERVFDSTEGAKAGRFAA